MLCKKVSHIINLISYCTVKKTLKFSHMALIITFLCFALQQDLFCQNKLMPNKMGFSSKKEYKEIKKAIKTGNKFYEDKDYYTALSFYLQANKQSSALLDYRIGVCYLNTHPRTKSNDYFLKAYQKDPKVSKDIEYKVAYTYHLKYDFKKALEFYQKYASGIDNDELTLAHKRIEECKNGIRLLENKHDREVINLGSAINTSSSEYHPIILEKSNKLFFTSFRQVLDMNTNKAIGSENIFQSNKINETWADADNANYSDNENIALVGATNNGDILFFYDGSKNHGDIYYCINNDTSLSDPIYFPPIINSNHRETSLASNENFDTIFFVREDPNTSIGGSDIYMSYKEKDGKWADAINLGPNINSEYNESGVFYYSNTKELFFCSDGHSSIGGYDIFKSHRLDSNTWLKAQNIGIPINTPDNDFFFFIPNDSDTAYFSSVRDEGFGYEDIYFVEYSPVENTISEKDTAINKLDTSFAKNTNDPINVTHPNSVNINDNNDQNSITDGTNDVQNRLYFVKIKMGNIDEHDHNSIKIIEQSNIDNLKTLPNKVEITVK